jgi:outer membrane receptor protein involved in Fe transport
VGAFFYTALLGGAYGPYAGQPYAINDLGVVNNGVAPGAPGAFKGELKEHNTSYRVGIDWKPQPGLLFYANVSKGYKAGSFPTISASVFSQYLPVVQESVQAYEAGFKASLFDRALQLNGAAFYYDYKNKQLRSKKIDPVFGLLDNLQNIPKSSVQGFEVEAIIKPIPYVTLSSAFTYLDATIDKYTGINGSGVLANFKGTPVPFTPKYQIGTNLDLDVPVSSSLNFFSGVSVTARSKTTATIGGSVNPVGATPNTFPLFGVKGYATVDMQIGVKASDDRWRLSIWGKNITNTYYWNNTVAAVDSITRYAAMPATYGIAASFRM